MDDKDRALIATTIAAAVAFGMCLPLFFACAPGDSEYPRETQASESLFSLIAFLPALAVLMAAPFRRLQLGLLALLGLIFVLELIDGIEPTSQLNHEGSDLGFLVLHFLLFILAVAITLPLAMWRWFTRNR